MSIFFLVIRRSSGNEKIQLSLQKFFFIQKLVDLQQTQIIALYEVYDETQNRIKPKIKKIKQNKKKYASFSNLIKKINNSEKLKNQIIFLKKSI